MYSMASEVETIDGVVSYLFSFYGPRCFQLLFFKVLSEIYCNFCCVVIRIPNSF